MKNFIKTLFAVLLGNAIFFGIFFLIMLLAIAGAMMSSNKEQFTIDNDSVLKLSVNSSFSEKPMSSKEVYFSNDKPESIHSVVSAIKIAKEDADIRALWIDMNANSDISYAQVDLLREAIVDFKKSKKPVVAYGEIASQKSYYLSTVADKIYINPNGGMDVRGFGAQLTFFKNTLDKLDIQPQIFYAGKYKSATEPFRLNKMSEENKMQTKELLKDISDEVLTNIADDRKISVAQLNEAINTMKSNIPNDAVSSKLIDGSLYLDEVESKLKNWLKVDADATINWVSINKYAEEKITNEKGKIAVYIAEGNIIDGKSTESSLGSITFVKDMRKIAHDNSIKGLVLRVNSPGGSALASSVMLRELKLLRAVKPVVVSMGDVAASGGYYIACEADKVFAEPNTITGSIGVFGIVPNVGKLLNDKLGVTFDEVELNDHAVLGINKNLDEIEKSKIQLEIENVYHTFKSVVSKGRGMSMDTVEMIAQGRVWSGTRAKKLGLVSQIGGLKDAVSYLAEKIKVDNDNYYFYNRQVSDFEEFINNMSSESAKIWVQHSILKSCLGDYYDYFKTMLTYTSIRGTQTRMLYEVKIK